VSARDIVGIDLSLNSTGWALAEEYGTITTTLVGAERLEYVYNELKMLLEKNNYPGVIIENYSFASKGSRQFSIGEVGGVARLLFKQLGISFVEVPPTCRAKFATGKGNASKNEVISSISARTGIVWSGKGADDMCDAWVLLEMGLCALGKPRFDWPQLQKSVLDKIDWAPLEVYCA
jgi:Holliday junction resolvasome RuvABC endonuclease subunit